MHNKIARNGWQILGEEEELAVRPSKGGEKDWTWKRPQLWSEQKHQKGKGKGNKPGHGGEDRGI